MQEEKLRRGSAHVPRRKHRGAELNLALDHKRNGSALGKAEGGFLGMLLCVTGGRESLCKEFFAYGDSSSEKRKQRQRDGSN